MDASARQRAVRLAQISQQLLTEPDERLTLARITELATQMVAGCDLCGVSLRRAGGRVETPAATSPLVEEADALQYALGEGPCLDAIWVDDTYLIEDTTVERRWPQWAPKAAALGIGSILSVRLGTTTAVLGGLNLYALRPHAFTGEDVDVAHLYAAHAAGALEAAQLVTGLRTALQTRQEIGVAQGILMQRYGLSTSQAFEVLRRHSQERNIKLRQVARDVVTDGALPPLG